MSLTPAANLLQVPLTPVASLPPVSTTPAVAVAKFAGGFVDTVSVVLCASISHECYVKYVCLFSRLLSSESIVIDV